MSKTCERARPRRKWCRSARRCDISDTTARTACPRYNLFPAAEVQGATLPGFSTGQAIGAMEKILAQLPSGFGFEWTEIALQEKSTGNTAIVAFTLAVVFVFLLLAAQYESVSCCRSP